MGSPFSIKIYDTFETRINGRPPIANNVEQPGLDNEAQLRLSVEKNEAKMRAQRAKLLA